MEDYIYIIIGLIWLVFTAIKGNQKKKSQQQQAANSRPTAAPQPNEQKSFEDILSEILNPTATVIQSTVPEYDEEEPLSLETMPEEPKEEERRTEYQSLEEIFAAEAESRLAAISVMELPNEDEATTITTLQKKQKNHIDLRKAIVYQAILERPYA